MITMRLVEAAGTKCLAGISPIGETAYVLRRQDAETYLLYCLPIDDDEQSLRSFLSADESLAGELTHAILKTVQTTPEKPRRRRRKARAK